MPLQLDWLLDADFRYLLAVVVLFTGVVLGYLVGRVNERILLAMGVDQTVEATSVEQMARELGTTTVSLTARLTSWIIYGVSVLIALEVAQLTVRGAVWYPIVTFVPSLVLAVVVLLFGVLLSDKAELVVSERLRSVKVPEITVLPRVVKYSIMYVAVLVALSQVGVQVTALVVLLFAYVGALVLYTAIATRHLLTSAAAGLYLLLNQPYGIGDRVAIGEHEGIVQEVDVFVTRIEGEGREYVLPNHLVFRRGVVLVRE
ncbi:mechanosensitive ion channel protein MscS [Halobacterium sp. DL1]|jgi:small-conductance mechanosensitive channel|nr:mechanosensitive ion channel protein MscS [Halobacterium sp. DL1]